MIDQIDENVRTRLQAAVAQHADAMIAFAQRAIQTRSLPGEEQELATLVKQEMERLGYDEVWIDRVGNVIGVLKGQGQGRSVQFNAHLDHV
ncbi:MAG: peptidase dimerization protein, partial [Thermorudis peleae]|nr:peptidase dimerization protein [Thermorudis peleae]